MGGKTAPRVVLNPLLCEVLPHNLVKTYWHAVICSNVSSVKIHSVYNIWYDESSSSASKYHYRNFSCSDVDGGIKIYKTLVWWNLLIQNNLLSAETWKSEGDGSKSTHTIRMCLFLIVSALCQFFSSFSVVICIHNVLSELCSINEASLKR